MAGFELSTEADQTVYAAIDPNDPQAIQGFSVFVDSTGRCESSIDGAPYFPAFYLEPVGRLDGMFTPPFTIRQLIMFVRKGPSTSRSIQTGGSVCVEI